MRSKPRFQTQVLAIVAPVLVAMTAFWAWYVYQSTYRIILDGFDRKLSALAGGTAALIDGDAHAAFQRRRVGVAAPPERANGSGESHATTATAPAQVGNPDPVAGLLDPNDPFYRRYRPTFVDLQKRAGLTYLYTQVYVGKRKIYYVMDGTVGANYSPPGTGDELPDTSVDPAALVEFLGKPWISPIQRWQVWGLLKSCFTPIRSSSGGVVAMAGADIDVGIIRSKTRWALFGAIFVGLCSLVAAGFVAFWIARGLTRPLQKLKEATLWIAAGYYDLRVETAGGSEISALAAALDGLRDGLSRDQKRSGKDHDDLRRRRECISVSQALAEETLHMGGMENPLGALGGCRAANGEAWWFGAPAADAVGADCDRARLTVLAHELLAMNCPPAQLLDRILTSAPELRGCACRYHADQALHFRMRQALVLQMGLDSRRLEGEGVIDLMPGIPVRWSRAAVPPPASVSAKGGSPA